MLSTAWNVRVGKQICKVYVSKHGTELHERIENSIAWAGFGCDYWFCIFEYHSNDSVLAVPMCSSVWCTNPN